MAKDQHAVTVSDGSAVVSSHKKTNDLSASAKDTNTSLKDRDPVTSKEITSRANEADGLPTDKIENTTKNQNAGAIITADGKTSKNKLPVENNKQVIDENIAATADNVNTPGTNNKIKSSATAIVDNGAANEKWVKQHSYRLNTKQFADNGHSKLRNMSAASAFNNNSASATNNDNRNYRSESKEKKPLLNGDGTVADNIKNVSPLTAYLYQSPLVLSVIEQPAPGPFKAIDKPSFLNSIQQNDSLTKVYAIAKMKTVSGHSISVMPFVSPNYSFMRLEDNSPFAGPGRNKNAAEREERQSTSFSAGVLVNYGLTKSVIVQSGLVFSYAKTNILPKTIYARPDNNGHARYEFNCASGYSYINPKTGASPVVVIA